MDNNKKQKIAWRDFIKHYINEDDVQANKTEDESKIINEESLRQKITVLIKDVLRGKGYMIA